MSDRSAIEWTDATWNPVRGCAKMVHLRGSAATVDILRVVISSLGLPAVARPKDERRMVDLTGIEPVTS